MLCAAFAAGVVNSIAGGGTLLTFPVLIWLGLDAKVVHELDRLRSGPIDLTSYALPAAMAFGFYSYPPLTVTVDRKQVCKDLPAVAFVGNIKEYGTGFPILSHATPTDGVLDICILPTANRADAKPLGIGQQTQYLDPVKNVNELSPLLQNGRV